MVQDAPVEGINRDEICTLDPILEELAREGKIKIIIGNLGDLISLKE